MDNKRKVIIGMIIVLVLIVGFILFRLSKSDTSENSSNSDNKTEETRSGALDRKETSSDNSSKDSTDDDKNTLKNDENDGNKTGALKSKPRDTQKGVAAPKESKAPKDPDKKDLEKTAIRFTELANKSITPENVKGINAELEEVATKKLCENLMGDRVETNENENRAKNIKVKIDKASKDKQHGVVTFDIYGKSSENGEIVKLFPDIKQDIWFKYEDGKFKVDAFKM